MEENNFDGFSRILNPIVNVNGYLTYSNQIYDPNWKGSEKTQSEINSKLKELADLGGSGASINEIEEYYTVYSASKYEGNGQSMKTDPQINWVKVPNENGEFPKMTTENPYLWNYEVFNQSGGRKIETEPVVVSVLGKGIKTTNRFYLVSGERDENSNPKKPGSDDSKWKPNSPATTESEPWLWEKQEIYYTDNLTEGGEPDETWITLIGTKGEKGIDGTDVEYIFCFWASKTDGPANPTIPEDWEDVNSEYQTKPDYIPYPTKDDFDSKKAEYYWSDDPVSVSKENPAQWICRREKKNGVWGKFSDPKLYSTYGDDGVSIEKIETWYLISDTNILSDKIEGAVLGDETKKPEPNFWYKNSPAVTKDHIYLWKKTILTFSADIYDNPDTELDETKTSTSIRYEVVGSLGTPGIDGDTVEWIYTRTKTLDEPPAIEINEETDKDRIDSYDYIPHPTKEDFDSEESEYEYYWSDDIQPCTSEYIYAWRAKRTKVGGKWGEFSTPVNFLYYVKDGVTPNRAYKSIVFCRSTQKPSIESGEKDGFNTYDNPIPPVSEKDGIKFTWSDGIPEGNEPLWSSTRIFSSDGKDPQQENWTDPSIMTDTLDVEFIYSSKQDKPDTPLLFTGNSDWFVNNPDWTDDPDAAGNSIWMAVSNRVNNVWSEWTISKIKGEKGDDGTSIKVSGHYKTEADFKTDWQEDGGKWIDPGQGPATDDYIEKKPYSSEACFVVEGNLWIWDGSDEWINVGKFTGDPGKTIYFYAIYTNSINDPTIKLTENNIPGKYIATFTSEEKTLSETFTVVEVDGVEGIKAVKTIDGPKRIKEDLNWIRWQGEDGYGYEYIYKLTKTLEDEPNLPNYDVNGKWEEPEGYQNSDYNPDEEAHKDPTITDKKLLWHDDPLTVDKDYPYCWQAYRMKVDGKWQPWKGNSNTTKAVLWSKFGKDGLTLFSKSWYCIAPKDATKDSIIHYLIPNKNSEGKWEVEDKDGVKKEIAEGAAKYWWENSPTVTEEYPNLWKKTTSEYKEYNADGSVEVESQTTYELIGSKGDKGVDGTDIEWAYILTKKNICPTSNSTDYFYKEEVGEGENITTASPSTTPLPLTSTLKPGTVIINELWPSNEITGNIPGNWTDDPQDVSEEWQYQWVVKRTKVNNVWSEWGIKQSDENGNIYYKASRNNSYGTHISAAVSYYKTSSDTVEIPDADTYNDLIAALGDSWRTSVDDENLILSPEANKLYEITIFSYTDGSYDVSGPIIKDEWKDTNIQSNVFCRCAEKPDKPGETEGSYSDPYPDNIVTRDYWWTDGIPDLGEGGPEEKVKEYNNSSTVWTTSAIFRVTDIEGPTYKTWSEPIQLTDSSDIQVRYSTVELDPGTPESNEGNWTENATSSAIWMAIRTKSYGNWKTWKVSKIKGEAGKDAPGANLILNSAFDNETDKLEHWSTDSDGTYEVSKNPVWEHKVYSLTANGNLEQDLSDLAPESYYTLSFRLSILNSNTVSIILNDLDPTTSIYNRSESLVVAVDSDKSNNWIITPDGNNNSISNQLFFITFKTRKLNDNEDKPWKLIFSYNHFDQDIIKDKTYTVHSIKLEAGKTYTEYQRAQEDLKGRYITNTLTHYTTTTEYHSNPDEKITNWGDSIPENLEDGIYLWTRTTIQYTKGLDTVTYSVSKTGIDGKGIKSSTTYYYVSENPIDDVKSVTDWSESYPDSSMLVQGHWLYTKTEVIYSDGKPTDTYSSSQIGTGSYYAGLQEYYCLGNSSSEAPKGYPIKKNSDGEPLDKEGYVDGVALYTKDEKVSFFLNWTTSRPTKKSIDTPYLWNFSISRDSNGNQYVCYPICIGNYAKGIDTIHELYAISSYSEKDLKSYNETNNSELLFPPDITKWDDEDFNSIPTEEKPYQWNQTITTYDDDDKTTDTFYHVSAVKNKDTQPNILKNSNFDVYDKNGKIAYWTDPSSNFYQINENGYLSYNSIKTKASGTYIVKQTLPSMYKGDKFTFSCMARIGNTTSTNNSGITITKLNGKVGVSNIIGLDNAGGVNDGYDFWFDTNTEWSKKSFTIECTSDEGIESPVLSLYVWSGWGEYSMLKFEKSEVATPYVKHVDDNKAFSPVVADLDNEMDSIGLDSEGKVVGENDKNVTLSTNVWMYEGNTKLALTGVSSSFTNTDVISVNSSNDTANKVGTVSVTFTKGKYIDVPKITIPITLEAIDSNGNSQTRELSFIINTVKPGLNGISPTLYRLIPSTNKIIRDKNNALIPNTITIYGQESKEGVITTITNVGSLSYEIDSDGSAQTLEFGTKLNIADDKFKNAKSIKFIWTIDDKEVDIETIPILEDGQDGANNQYNLLDNTSFTKLKDCTTNVYPDGLTQIKQLPYKWEIGTDALGINEDKKYINVSIITETTGFNSVRVQHSGTYPGNNGDYFLWGSWALKYYTKGILLPNTWYTFSFYVKGTVALDKFLFGITDGTIDGSRKFYYNGVPNDPNKKEHLDEDNIPYYTYGISKAMPVIGNWEKQTITFLTTSSLPNDGFIYFTGKCNTSHYYQISRCKLEISENQTEPEKSRASSWCTSENDQKLPFKSTVFKRHIITDNSEKPSTPTNGTYDNPVPSSTETNSVNYGWEDGIPSGDGAIFSSTRTFDAIIGGIGTWSEPQLMVDNGELDVAYCIKEVYTIPPPTPGSNGRNDEWTNEATTNAIWMATSNKTAGGTWSNWTITKIKGENGLTTNPNLIKNSNFDLIGGDDNGLFLQNWTYGGMINSVRRKDVVLNGYYDNNSFKVTKNSSNSCLFQEIPLEIKTGTKITFSCLVKTSGIKYNSSGIQDVTFGILLRLPNPGDRNGFEGWDKYWKITSTDIVYSSWSEAMSGTASNGNPMYKENARINLPFKFNSLNTWEKKVITVEFIGSESYTYYTEIPKLNVYKWFSSSDDLTVEITQLKLEVGDQATPYLKHYEDNKASEGLSPNINLLDGTSFENLNGWSKPEHVTDNNIKDNYFYNNYSGETDVREDVLKQNITGKLSPNTWYTLSFKMRGFINHEVYSYPISTLIANSTWSGTDTVVNSSIPLIIDGIERPTTATGEGITPSLGSVIWKTPFTGTNAKTDYESSSKTWEKHTLSFKTRSILPSDYIFVIRQWGTAGDAESGYFEITEIKLEKGLNATAWSLSSNDIIAKEPIIADLDNEMDSIVLDSEGKVVGGTDVISDEVTGVKLISNVWMYEGSTALKLDSVSITNPNINGVTVTANKQESDLTKGTITVSVPNGTEISVSKITIPIEITAKDSKKEVKTRNLSFIINVSKPGADGKPAVAYKLIPSVNSIVRKKNNGGFIPQMITFYGQKNIGGVITDIKEGQNAIGYHLNGTVWNDDQKLSFEKTSGKDNTSLTLTTNKFDESIKSIRFAWRINDVDVDVETIPILKEGEDGINGKDGLSPEPNLLINSNFDLYDGDKLKGWEILNGEVIEKSFNGFNSYQYTTTTANNFLSTTTPKLEAELFYTLSFYYKNTTISTLTDTFNVTFIGGEQKIREIISTDNNNVLDGGNRSSYFKSSSSWRKVSISFKTAVSNTIEIRFYKPTITSSISISQPKLELGQAASPYTKNQNDLVGPAGGSGKNMYPAGNWDSDREYKIENNSVPFVYYESNYYILLTESSKKNGSNVIPGQNSTVWGIFKYTPFQFSEFLMAKWAKFGGENGAVFYDRYLFSQMGHGNASYEDYVDGNPNGNPPMFSGDELSGSFIPKLHLDFLNGLANLSCLCEPYVTYEENNDGIIRIDPSKGFNVKIPCNENLKITPIGEPLPMLHPLVILPTIDPDSTDSMWTMDGSHITILFENKSGAFSKVCTAAGSGVDKQNVFLLISVDDLGNDGSLNFGETKSYDENFIFCNNKRGKFLILSPGSMVKLRQNVTIIGGKKRLYWNIENSGNITSEPVNFYCTNTRIKNEGSGINLNNTGDKLYPLHGAYYSDSLCLGTDWIVPEESRTIFFAGPQGFCPRNIVYTTQSINPDSYDGGSDGSYIYRYRALDFIGKINGGGEYNPTDSAEGFTISPLI